MCLFAFYRWRVSPNSHKAIRDFFNSIRQKRSFGNSGRQSSSRSRSSQRASLKLGYPYIKVEIINDYGLTDIVAQRFDAGVRDGEQIAKDMIAVRIAPNTRMAVVATPFYFRSRPEPKKPQDLVEHNCI